MTSTLSNLSDEVSQLKADFEKLRTEINSNLNKYSNSIESVQKLCLQVTQMTTSLEDKLANALNDEKEWKEIKIKLATTSLKNGYP
jgi:septation ring formation regulator EzrA